MTMEYKKILLTFDTPKEISLDQTSRLLYYLNNTYKILYFTQQKRNVNLDYVNLIKLKKGEELKLAVIKKTSPFQIEILIPLLVGALTIPKTFLETLRIIRDWDLDRERKKLENEKLRWEIQKMKRLEDFKIINVEEK